MPFGANFGFLDPVEASGANFSTLRANFGVLEPFEAFGAFGTKLLPQGCEVKP